MLGCEPFFPGDTRPEQEARYMIETGATVRAAAAKFGVSKSTVHKDVTDRLRQWNPSLWRQAQSVLRENKEVRHLRGGEATRKKYLERNLKKSG